MAYMPINRLRKIHPIRSEDKLREYMNMKGAWPPVSIHTYRGLPEVEIVAVVDGIHRTQAAVQLNLAGVDCVEVSESEARAEALERGLNFDDLIHRATPFEKIDFGGGR